MKQFIKKFNSLIKKIIFKLQNKTNNIFNIINFNNLIKKKKFKVKKKKINDFKISSFNKYLIGSISFLFFYLFYLSTPILYDKIFLQNNIENQLLNEFKINFSISSDISYRILPKPHFLIKDSKIFKEDDDKITSLADIKTLKVFVSQKNFFNKEKITITSIAINNANFLLLKNDFKLLKNERNNKFSNKRIQVNKSNIFFKNNLNKTITIIKISKAFLFFEGEDLLNLFNLKGSVFNIPFNFKYKKKFDNSYSQEIDIIAKKLKLNFFDIHSKEESNSAKGENILSFLNYTINTGYKINNGVIFFNSINSKKSNLNLDYNGKLSINPFNLDLNVNTNNYNLFKTLNSNMILNELIKTELLFNENISANISINTRENLNKKIFQSAKINFDIVNGRINFDKTKLINKKIGFLELDNSNLFFANSKLILNTNVIVNISSSDELFSLIQTNKKFRKPIKDILINLDYDFSTSQIRFNNVKIDNKEANSEILRIIEDFNDNKLYNWNKTKRLLNELFKSYEG